jgi:transposase-like protein
VVITIAGKKHWLWRAVDQDGIVFEVLVQSRRDKQAAQRLLRKLLKKQMRPPRVLITDKLASWHRQVAGARAVQAVGRGGGADQDDAQCRLRRDVRQARHGRGGCRAVGAIAGWWAGASRA